MKLIGENLNIMSKKYGAALKARDAKPLQELAIEQAKAGMDWIDLNIGPAGKTGVELMSWLVPAIEEVVDVPARSGYLERQSDRSRPQGLQEEPAAHQFDHGPARENGSAPSACRKV